MPKKIIRDVVPKYSIREIPLPKDRKRNSDVHVKTLPQKHTLEEKQIPDLKRTSKTSKKRRGPNFILWGVVLVSLFVVVFALTAVFEGATIHVTPRSQNITIANSFVAKKSGAPGELIYNSITVTGEKTATIPSSGNREVTKKATGVVVLYNNYSTAAQRLVAGTRLQAGNQLIYKTDKTITIPGKTAAKPGSVEVVVTAENAGDNYNSDLTDFVAPAYKGGAKYTGIYGRSKTTLAGGYVGVESVINSEDLKKADQNLYGLLRNELIQKAVAQVPADYILYDGASEMTISTTTSPVDNTKATLTGKGTLKGVLLKKDDLTMHLIDKNIEETQGEVFAKGIEKLVVQAVTPKTGFTSAEQITFSVKGPLTVIWKYQTEALRQAFAGKLVSKTSEILKSFPNVERVDITIKPFWKKTLPKNKDRITVK
jgi:hypothetical protein